MAASKIPSVAVKKRQQIADSSRTMFFWVAGASVIVSFAIVAVIFLWQQGAFNEKQLSEKADTINTLKKDIEAAKGLDDNISTLQTDPALKNLRVAGSNNNLDVILDAMPYEGDVVSLGSSLEKKLLNEISVDSLSVTDAEILDQSQPTDTSNDTALANTQSIPFSFKVTGNETQLADLLKKFNKSIRPFRIIGLTVKPSSDDKLELEVRAITYYQDKKTFELSEKAVKP